MFSGRVVIGAFICAAIDTNNSRTCQSIIYKHLRIGNRTNPRIGLRSSAVNFFIRLIQEINIKWFQITGIQLRFMRLLLCSMAI